MGRSVILILVAALTVVIGAANGRAEEPTITTFTGSTIERIDAPNQQVTFRTLEGQSWSLQVTKEDLLRGLQPGDRVSLELDAQDRVKNIVRVNQGAQASPGGSVPSE